MPWDERLLLIVLAFAGVGVLLTIVLMFMGVAGWRHYANWSGILPGLNERGHAWARRVLPAVLLAFVLVGSVFGLCVALAGELGDTTIPSEIRWILGLCSAGLAVFVGLMYGRAFCTMERKKP